ncbi:50S ribosomal protein L2 [Candidatus Woesearchaeota archaeon]|nr:50S ribosomal protein L2 [Candidatus Woesearchaeota archaeon]
MGKNLIQQARGRGGPNYRARSFAYAGEARHLHPSANLQSGTITEFIKCPGHLAPLAQIKYPDGQTVLVQAAEGLKVGDTVTTGQGGALKDGNTLSLKDLPEGTAIFNIESTPGDGGKFCRTTGTFARIVTKAERHVIIQLPSKKQRLFHPDCRAVIGVVAGSGRTEKPFLKAGAMHWHRRSRNKRWPNPSAAAQNAVDHPFGNKRTSRKGKQRVQSKHAPPGRKVGKIGARRTGRKK